MSDAPETIWAECSAHKNWDDLNASQYKVEWWHEYRRADLPPTPEQIDTDPRVQALVEALERIADMTSHNMGMSARDENCANHEATTALAAFKEMR